MGLWVLSSRAARAGVAEGAPPLTSQQLLSGGLANKAAHYDLSPL